MGFGEPGGGTMVDILSTPFLWVVVTIGLYGVAYWGYGKWIDRNVWRSNAKKATPAHMYMDGVEYFPVSRYVLWGYQFKSIAALGPILGPFIGITFGWLPALLWIIGGNFFIGLLQDYGAMMLSVPDEGRSVRPVTYEVTGAPGPSEVAAVILYAAAVLPTPMFVQPTNYLAFYPAYAAILLILFGALMTPFWGASFLGLTLPRAPTPISIQMPAGPFWFDPQGILGPIWPILFVAIACGAISGWHSLVSSSSSAKQLDIETDALPVGGGAMLSEGLLALASLIAYMVLAPSFFVGRTNVAAWVAGAVTLTTPFLGGLTAPILTTFFGLVLIIYALTVQALVTRFFRLVAAESWSEGRFHMFGNKHVSTVVGLGIPWAFAVSGSWWALWLYFGGANQLLAGLAIMLITIHLARTRAPTKFSLIPGVFMIVTTLAALVWQTGTFLYSVWAYLNNDNSWVLRNVRPPINTKDYILVAVAINAVFVAVGTVLFAVGLSMAVRLFRSYRSSMAERRARAPAAADGGERER